MIYYSRPIKNIIKLLNDPTTPLIIKKDFIELLEIKEKNLDYKFETKDFEQIIKIKRVQINNAPKSFVRKLMDGRNEQKQIKQR